MQKLNLVKLQTSINDIKKKSVRLKNKIIKFFLTITKKRFNLCIQKVKNKPNKL